MIETSIFVKIVKVENTGFQTQIEPADLEVS